MPADPILVLIAVAMLGVTAAMFCIGWQIHIDRRDRRPDDGLGIFDEHYADVHVTPSPLLYVPSADDIEHAERAGRFADMVTDLTNRIRARGGPGQHRAIAPQDRDPRVLALLTTTQEFDARFAEMVEQLELPLEAS